MLWFQGEGKVPVKKAQRIISVVPSQTELLFNLGLTEEVIGITKFCVHPDEWFRKKVKIGGTKKLNIKKIRELKPDLILANQEENLKEEIELLSLEFDVWISKINNLNDAMQMIREIGIMVNKKVEAEDLYENINSSFKLYQPVKKQKAVYLIWNNPLMTIGGDTFISDMMLRAGFINLFSNDLRYPEISIQILQELKPEVLMLSSEPFPFAEKHLQEFRKLLPDCKIKLVDGEMFSWYGSRLLESIKYFRQLDT